MAPACVAVTPAEEQCGYDPSPWGDFFIGYEPQQLQRSKEWMMARAGKLKEDVEMLFKACSNTPGRIGLIDSIENLGIDRHFKEHINTASRQILQSGFNSNLSLHDVALGFRLLREHGHWVSPDVFNQFKGEDGSFSKDISNDPRGLLSLYNAAHLYIHGEPILEEAITFARHHLTSMSDSDLKSPLANQIKRALHIPLPRACRRIETLYYISEYKEEEGHNPILLELAKLDFNLLQHYHLKELNDITEWWNDFSGNLKLNFIRSRLVESYTWAYVVYYEEGFELPRSISTKMTILITTIDDVCDIRATIDECRILHEAIQIWDESAASILPDYMKRLYMEVLRMFKNIEDDVPVNVNYNVAYLRKAIQDNVSGYLQESEWSQKNHKPSFEDQVKLTSITVGAPTLALSAIAGMDDSIMKQALEWAAEVPDVVVALGKIVRFMNDIAAFKRRKCKGDAESTVECYMNEHGVTGEMAIARIDELMEDEWKILHEARFANPKLLPAIQRIIALAQSASFFYDNRNDMYTLSTHIRATIESLFVKPI